MRTSLAYAAALLAVGTQAAPLEQRSTVTSSQLSTFTLFSQYAGAAYCFDNVHKNGTKMNCSDEKGSCPLVESSGATIIDAFEAGSTKTLGYVALDTKNKLIIVAIQGTQIWTNPIDIITDADLLQVKSNLCGSAAKHDGCLVHKGFYEAMQDAAVVVVPAVKAAAKANPSFRVVVTGHSLGGAVSALLGVTLRNSGMAVDMYTFGQPKLGNVDISNYIQGQAPSKGNNYRVTHFNDVVPQLPEHTWGNDAWDHYYPEFWINQNQGTVSTSNMKVVDGTLFSTAGNEGTNSALGLVGELFEGGVAAHGLYFGKISACSSKAPFAPSAANSSGQSKK